MDELPEDFFERMKAVVADDRVQAKKQGYYQTLAESDALLKATIEYWETGTRPKVDVDQGSVEWGIIPYWAAHPSDELPKTWQDFLKDLVKYGVIPPPTVTPSDYEALRQHVKDDTAIAGDGTIFGTGPYEQLNWRWVYAVANDMITHVMGKAHFGKKPYVGSLPASGPITIALIGDWGTGASAEGESLPAPKVMDAAQGLDPDFLIHLGDVYYTGQPKGLDDLYVPYDGDTEAKNLVDLWPARAAKTSFTLNSNHEMYCGAKGLFEVAYPSAPFEHQNGTSYFLLQNDDWQVFGLDSAYFTTSTLYMEGSLDATQKAFLQAHADPKKKIILLTHHTGLNDDGTQVLGLWGDVEAGLAGKHTDGQPDYWYWGHIHNGIAYKGVGRQPAARNHTVARCVGHGSIPYGCAWSLTKPGSVCSDADYIDTVEFFAHEAASGKKRKGQVKNGFTLLTLNGSNLTEAFYDEDGTQVWPLA